MARVLEQLTEATIRRLKEGLHADGGGLYLQIRPRAQSWIFRFTLMGRTRDKGLGSLTKVSLSQARTAAAECRAIVARGLDPIEQARTASPEIQAAELTFEDVAERYMDERLKEMRNEKGRGQWRYTLRRFAYPLIGLTPISKVGTHEVLQVLRPIWETRCSTAGRLRGRIERILAYAAVSGLRDGPNPAAWRGHLQEALPAPGKVRPRTNFAAMEYVDVPAFMRELALRDNVSAAGLRFLILTATRTNETLGARWVEFDLEESIWTVPAERTKSGRPHIVPLSTGAAAQLQSMKALRDVTDGYVFPGRSGGRLSEMTLLALLQRCMKRSVTVHGFRSSFRDWCGDEANVDRELAEASLAHVVKNATERAYRRKTAVEKRRVVMQQWCDYCLRPSASVVDMTEGQQKASVAA